MPRWNQKIVVVTGGSQGLGRELALAFARQSATVIILARDSTRLQQIVVDAGNLPHTIKLVGIAADVTDDASVKAAIAKIVAEHQHIDVWINNVGQSTRTALLDCTIEKYQALMETNFYSAVRCTLEVLPQLQQTSGQLVNIGSLASKTAWPFVAPYATSKHALAAFTQQLRLEGPRNVNYLHVCPGPIQRLDADVRYATESAGLDKSAAAPGAGVKLKGIEPWKLAEKIELACHRRKTELVVPGYAKFLFALAEFFPKWADGMLLRSRKKRET